MRRSPPLWVCLLLGLLLLGGCSEARYGVPSFKLRYTTPSERRASLSVLRHAWSERPREANPDANLYERALINRAAYFGRKIRGTETYSPACDFWMSCVRDHFARYEDEAHRFRQ